MACVIHRHDKKVDFIANCYLCYKTVMVEAIPADGYAAWRKGTLIQNALPSLSDDEREFLMSETCSDCYHHTALEAAKNE